MTLTEKHDARILNHGIFLHRYYLGDSPDDLGTPDFWEGQLEQLYKQMPDPNLWPFSLHVYHMDCPSLVATGSTLRDYDTTKPGYQTATGLTWNKDKIDLGVFPDNWQADLPAGNKPTIGAIQSAADALSHECGHRYDFACGWDDEQSIIQKEMTRIFDKLRPAQAENRTECFAEVYRALFGGDRIRGTFSDNKPFTGYSPQLYTIMRCAYWLNRNLGAKFISDLVVTEDKVWWQEWANNNNGTLASKGYWAVNTSWELLQWTNAKGPWGFYKV